MFQEIAREDKYLHFDITNWIISKTQSTVFSYQFFPPSLLNASQASFGKKWAEKWHVIPSHSAFHPALLRSAGNLFHQNPHSVYRQTGRGSWNTLIKTIYHVRKCSQMFFFLRRGKWIRFVSLLHPCWSFFTWYTTGQIQIHRKWHKFETEKRLFFLHLTCSPRGHFTRVSFSLFLPLTSSLGREVVLRSVNVLDWYDPSTKQSLHKSLLESRVCDEILMDPSHPPGKSRGCRMFMMSHVQPCSKLG